MMVLPVLVISISPVIPLEIAQEIALSMSISLAGRYWGRFGPRGAASAFLSKSGQPGLTEIAAHHAGSTERFAIRVGPWLGFSSFSTIDQNRRRSSNVQPIVPVIARNDLSVSVVMLPMGPDVAVVAVGG